MSTVSATNWFCLVIIAVVIAYDLYAVLRWGTRGTVSHTVRTFTEAHPWLAFLSGVLVGHWFF